MGFRSGAYATVWESKSISPSHTKLKISISYKDKNTGEYTQDFSGFVSVFGTSAAAGAAQLMERSRIKLGDCDVSTTYDKERQIGYTNFKIFSFENLNQGGSYGGNQSGNQGGGTQYGGQQQGGNYGGQTQNNYSDPSANQGVDSGVVDDSQERLPF